MQLLCAALIAYLIGSIPFAVIMSRAFGLADPRSYGSRNPGATNVLRSGHRLAAALTLIFDAAKGTAAVLLAKYVADQIGGAAGVAVVAVAVFLGHLFPIFLGFKGGKGVATALGVMLGLAWWVAGACALVWLLVAVIFRYSSLASLIAAVFAPLFYAFAVGASPITLALALISLGVIARHHGNIRKLLNGKESRIGKKASA
jgi:glycerol-3-phosphate acyltransferase PlsY